MNVNHPDEKAVFKVASSIESPEVRRDYLDQICRDNPSLQRRVLKLLRMHEEEPDFLEASPVGIVATMDAPPITEQPGTVIGRYKLMEQIGEGGMGIVYVAEQEEPVRRKVALKIIKPGMDTKQVIARFEAERQALAMMDHPNIARVLDASATEEGRPYFVMELVPGVPVTEYGNKHRLPTRKRLELFVQICQAVQHAHQKGIIHRDIKPANVLITLHDGVPVPKVIDFGIAKAINQRLTERTVYTQMSQMIGTPLYMSPEQAELSDLNVDTRTDIYSLGVLLYELLTGSTPFAKEQLSEAGHDEMRRIIREDEPPRPSDRISTLDGQLLSTISEQRSSDPRKLTQIVRGELDWIVMKALEKDRTRRYETASAMAADVGHFLKDEPVSACPPSASFRFAKFARRNKTLIVTASLIAASLIVGIIGTSWQAYESRQNERKVEQKARESQAVVDFLVYDLLAAAVPEQALGHDVTVAEVLINAEAKIENAFKDQPLVEAFVRHALGFSSHRLGDYESARRHSARACEIRTQLLGRENHLTLHSISRLGAALNKLGNPAAAEKLHREALEGRRRVLGEVHPATLASMGHLARSLCDQGKYTEAVALQSKVLEVERRTYGTESPQVFGAMQELAITLEFMGRDGEAEQLMLAALEGQRHIWGPEHPRTLNSMYNIALLLSRREKYAESEKLNREVLEARLRILGLEHPQTLRTMCNLAGSLVRLGRFEEACRFARRALDGLREVEGPDYADTLATENTLAEALEGLGRLKEARDLWEEALELSRLHDPSDQTFADWVLRPTLRGLALNIALTEDAPPDDPERAIELAQQAIELNAEEPESWRVLGVVCAASGQWQPSLDAFKRALKLGYREELIPSSILQRLERSDKQSDDSYQQLLDFLREHESTEASVLGTQYRTRRNPK